MAARAVVERGWTLLEMRERALVQCIEPAGKIAPARRSSAENCENLPEHTQRNGARQVCRTIPHQPAFQRHDAFKCLRRRPVERGVGFGEVRRAAGDAGTRS